MGQPLKGLRYGGLSVGTFGSDYNFAGYGSIGIYKDIVNPALSEVAFSLEGYLGGRTQELDGGFRALLGSRVLRIGGVLSEGVADSASTGCRAADIRSLEIALS